MSEAMSLATELHSFDRESFSERLAQLRFISKVVLRSKYVHFPVLAVQFFEEAKICLVNGAFIACITCCQLLCEEMLKSLYRGRGDIKTVELNFHDLIDAALDDNFIEKEEAMRLHHIREVRNKLQHSKDFSRIGKGSKKRLGLFYSYPYNITIFQKEARAAFKVANRLMMRGAWLAE